MHVSLEKILSLEAQFWATPRDEGAGWSSSVAFIAGKTSENPQTIEDALEAFYNDGGYAGWEDGEEACVDECGCPMCELVSA